MLFYHYFKKLLAQRTFVPLYYEKEVIFKMAYDRGTIKWTSLMLPEHVELLKQMWREDKKETKPILDPQEIELINQQVMESYEHQLLIQLTFFEDNQTQSVTCKIIKLNQETRKVSIETEDHKRTELPFSSLLSISIN